MAGLGQAQPTPYVWVLGRQGSAALPIPSQNHRLNVLFAFPAGQQDLLPPQEEVGTHPHAETPSQSSSTPEPGSMQWEQLQPCLSDPSGKSCNTGFAQTVLSCFNQLPPCLILSQPRLPPGTAVPPLAGGDSQGMELGEVPVPALQGQTWAC